MIGSATPPSLPQPERRLFKKRYVLFLLVAAFVTWQIVQRASVRSALRQARAAGQPVTFAELNAFYFEVPASNNLSEPLLRAAAALTIRTNQKRATDPFEYPASPEVPLARPMPPPLLDLYRGVVQSNAAVWIALMDAPGRTASRHPVDLNDGYFTELPHLGPLKRLAKACAIRALLASEEGRADECTAALADLFRTSRSLSHEPLAISSAVAHSVDALGMMAVRDCLQRVRFDDGQLAQLISDVRSTSLSNQTQRALIGERMIGHSMFSRLDVAPAFQGDPEAPEQAKVDFGLKLLNASGLGPNDNAFMLHVMARLIEAAGQPFPQALDSAERIEADFDQAISGIGRALHIFSGRFLLSAMPVIPNAANAEAHRRLSLTALAIERFRLRNGNQAPQSLAELVPTFLPEIPTDPFDGDPLRYQRNPEGYRLHSIGRDRVDQGGKAVLPRNRRNNYLATDLVFEVTR